MLTKVRCQVINISIIFIPDQCSESTSSFRAATEIPAPNFNPCTGQPDSDAAGIECQSCWDMGKYASEMNCDAHPIYPRAFEPLFPSFVCQPQEQQLQQGGLAYPASTSWEAFPWQYRLPQHQASFVSLKTICIPLLLTF